jgi:hypothetical protein
VFIYGGLKGSQLLDDLLVRRASHLLQQGTRLHGDGAAQQMLEYTDGWMYVRGLPRASMKYFSSNAGVGHSDEEGASA